MKVSRPNRVSRTGEQIIEASASRIFPLYCPVREADWIEGWDPLAVYTESGLVEPDCVFVTQSGEKDSVWVVAQHDPETFRVRMFKVTPGVTVCRLDIYLEPLEDEKTRAVITYSHTSLGPEGDAFVNDFTEDYYESFMDSWEAAMSHYLETGEILSG